MSALKLTERDRWVCAALPAVLTFVLWFIMFARPLGRDVSGLRAELRAQDPPDVRAERLETARQEADPLMKESQALRNSAATAAKAGIAADDLDSALARRAATLRVLSRRCEQAAVTLVRASAADGANAPGGAGTANRDLLDRMRWTDAAIWRLELQGTYEHVLGLLETLAEDDVSIVPVGIRMDPAVDEAKPMSWVLTVWI